MSRYFWSGGIALLLLLPATADADDGPAAARVRVGPGGVSVVAEPRQESGGPVRVQVDGKGVPGSGMGVPPVKVQVHSRLLPRRPVDVHAGPVRVHAGPDGVYVTGKPFDVITRWQLSDHWLGVECYPAGDALRTQLGLPAKVGLVVESVVPDSPAAKAGIQQHDVLLGAGEKPLAEVADLIAAIAASKEKELSIELTRGGKQQKITVTPAKRPKEQFHPGPPHHGHDGKRLRDYFGGVWSGEAPGGPWQFRFIHPPAVLPPAADVHPPMPGNMSVSVSKEGGKPAKIVVKQDDQQWEVTDQELDKLPEEVRPHVQRLLGRLPHGPGAHLRSFDFVPNWTAPGHPKDQIRDRPAPPKDPVEEQLDKRMEEMNRRIEELNKSIEDLREKRSSRKKPKKSPNSV